MKSLVRVAFISTLLIAACSRLVQSPGLEPAWTKGEIPTGTVLKVALIDAISTDWSTPGDHFSGILLEPVVIGGKIFLEKGTSVRGRVFDLRKARQHNGSAELRLTLTEILHRGQTIAITTRHFETMAATTGPARFEGIHYAAKARIDFILAMQVEL